MPRFRVIPYRAGSRSATALSRELGGMCLRLNGNSRFRPRADDILINWGNTDPPFRQQILNRNVREASNKRNFFQDMREAGLEEIIPQYWTDRTHIEREVFEGDNKVVCRTVLPRHSGEGIVIANTPAELVNAPLYTKYIKKQDEYRIHVGMRNDEPIVISVQRKARREAHENPNWQVRNHANGFVYVRGDVNPPERVIEAAKRCLQASGLDFGAVDVIYNQHQARAYVLEINTAPGLEGQTVVDYANFFRGN